MPLEEGCFGRFGKTRLFVGFGAERKSVDKQTGHVALSELRRVGEYVFDCDKGIIIADHARVAFLEVDSELGCEVTSLGKLNRRYNGRAGAFWIRCGGGEDVLHRVLLYKVARHGRDCLADATEEHAHVVVDFGGGADGRTRIARIHLLLDGDSRWQTLDAVTFGLVELA